MLIDRPQMSRLRDWDRHRVGTLVALPINQLQHDVGDGKRLVFVLLTSFRLCQLR